LYRGDFFPQCYEDWALGRTRATAKNVYSRAGTLIEKLEGGRRISRRNRLRAPPSTTRAASRGDILPPNALVCIRWRPRQRSADLPKVRFVLRQELAVAPSAATTKRYHEYLQTEPAERPATNLFQPNRGNLPAQLSSFIGRTREIREVQGLLGTCRFLTLTGTGGSGKTRLAQQVAIESANDYRDG